MATRIVIELDSGTIPSSVYLDVFGKVRDRESLVVCGSWEWDERPART